MTRTEKLVHEFVQHIPDELSLGVLYVSLPFATVIHLCCCGCGSEVVTPLSPTDWQLTYDGESVSLHPSIGNWSFTCQSHYWIRHGAVHWSGRWTAEQIAEGRTRDRLHKAAVDVPVTPSGRVPDKPKRGIKGLLARMRRHTRV